MRNDEDWTFDEDGAERRRDPQRRPGRNHDADDRDAFDLGGSFYSARWNNVAHEYGSVRKLDGWRAEEYSRYQELNDFEREEFFERED